MSLFRGIQEYIALDAYNIVQVEDIYSCISLKAIQYYIIILKCIQSEYWISLKFKIDMICD